MNTNEEFTYSPINNQAILSLLFGILTILSFCMNFIPIPFTEILCVPTSLLFGTLALVFGLLSLKRIRKQNESGRPMAWIGIMIGGFVFVCVICIIVAIISYYIFSPNSIHIPPFLDKYEI